MSPEKISGAAIRHHIDMYEYCSLPVRVVGVPFGLRVCGTDPADQDVIRIVPLARPGVLPVLRIGQADGVETGQRWFAFQSQIARRPPAVSRHLAAPLPDISHAVLAQS